MSFNSNLEVRDSARWETDSCVTQVNNDVKSGEQATLNCLCSEISNHYIGLITDKQRLIQVIIPHRLAYEIRLLAVIIPLLLLGICCPCFVTRWDNNALKKLEEDPYEQNGLTDDFIEHFKFVRKTETTEEVLYRLPQIDDYMKLTDNDYRVGSC